MRHLTLFAFLTLLVPASAADPFDNGVGIPLDQVIPANERGILCLAKGKDGRIYGGTTGRAAHLFVYDPKSNAAKSLVRLDGGIGFAYGLIALPDGSLVGGTQADPTKLAMTTDPAKVGHLHRFVVNGDTVKVEDLGVPVTGQGIYTLAYDPKSNTVVGNTWPDGHFFSHDVARKSTKDHGAIAGYRTFETPRHADALNLHGQEKIRYSRQVSRAILIADGGAFTGGADGWLHRFDCTTGKLEKTTLRLPSIRGRETWASLDAAIAAPPGAGKVVAYGGTSDGYLLELRKTDTGGYQLRPRGKPIAQPAIQGLVAVDRPDSKAVDDEHPGQSILGVGGPAGGMPRSFRFNRGGGTSAIEPGLIPHVDRQPSYAGFGAILDAGGGILYAGERDRIARLVRFGGKAEEAPKRAARRPRPQPVKPPELNPPTLDFHVTFAPGDTTTDGSGYTAIEVGKDGRVYVGSARYGGYASLLRFDPLAKPSFMDKVVSLRELTGEDRSGINTQGKIHSKILVGADGKIWFASKQAHEIFDTRPEYGEDPDGFPGGHLCYFDPKTGFSRSLGILKKQEGIVAGAIDDGRQRLYWRSEPKNNFLAYDLKTGTVQDRGHIGAGCRYMASDAKGRVYTIGRSPFLSRYDPATGYVEDLLIQVEGEGSYAPPYVIHVGPNGKLYGLTAGHDGVMEFDIDRVKEGAFPEVTMRNVCPAAPEGYPVEDIHAAIFGLDGKLYYPLNTTPPGGGVRKGHLLIMRFDPATRKCEVVGTPRPVGFDEEKVRSSYNRGKKFELRYMQGAAVSADGSLFLLGIYPQLHVACFPKLTK